jgi:hypothetical protein
VSEALFDVAPDRVRPARKTPVGNGKPKWGKYRPAKAVKCDDCLAVLAEADGVGPACRIARWKRTHGGADRILCGGHMAQRRHDDGLEPLKDPT